GAVQGARDGGRAFGALAVSADAATSAVTSVKTNVEQFAAHLSQIGALTAELAKLPDEGASIVATLGDLRTHLGDANRAWAEVADVTDGASQSMAKAGAALSSHARGRAGGAQLERRPDEGRRRRAGADRDDGAGGAAGEGGGDRPGAAVRPDLRAPRRAAAQAQ